GPQGIRGSQRDNGDLGVIMGTPGWLDGLEEQRQRTEVHYRSLQGDGAFNWRFVFSFEYLAAEQLCVLPRKEHFWSLDETVLKVPPKLILQVWDNDKFSADDFLATHIPPPPLGTIPRGDPSRGAECPGKWSDKDTGKEGAANDGAGAVANFPS
ncbi:PREDICTED: myoferlin-like, partial [Charadrius vociferus]|uniref:myoferlin-like n=1 Tax=Charadrius vociferus TaxID=50402 RepID=UPI000521AEB5